MAEPHQRNAQDNDRDKGQGEGERKEPYKLYDFVDAKGGNIIRAWTERLQKESRVRLNRKFDNLEQHGDDLSAQLLAETGTAHIKKLRITGKRVPTLRVMLCRGPIDVETEFTILQGAVKKDGKLIPPDAVERAEENRETVIADESRRCDHEQVA